METNQLKSGFKHEAIKQIQEYKAKEKNYDHSRFVMHFYDHFIYSEDDPADVNRGNIVKYVLLCQKLLALLANPEVSSKLPSHFQEDAGNMLLNMMNFFDYVYEDPICNIEFDLYDVNNNNLSEGELMQIIDNYKDKATNNPA